MPNYKLGRIEQKYDARDLKFGEYLKSGYEFHIPNTFGHENAFKNWEVLGNDKYGDCVWAGAAHETMLINNLASNPEVKFTADSVLSDYSAVTGFNSKTGENDNGTEVREALKYRQKTGVLDANGKRHQIGAYVSINPKNIKHIIQALWVFEAVGIGIAFPESAMTQFNQNKTWTVDRNSGIDGGHYIPLVGKPSINQLNCITWGRHQSMSQEFFLTYCQEAWAYITLEELNNRTKKNWGGFEWAALEKDLATIAN